MNSLLTGALIKIAISFALYFLAFLPMSYLPDLFINNNYSTFFYLPTGIKVLCVLLFDIWGAIGISLGVFVRQSIQHPEFGVIFPLSIALENAIVFFAAVKLTMRGLSVGQDIENLTYLKIILIALLASITHGLLYTFVLFEFGILPLENYLRESLVTVISGFFGTMVTILLLSLIAKSSPWIQHQIKVIEND